MQEEQRQQQKIIDWPSAESDRRLKQDCPSLISVYRPVCFTVLPYFLLLPSVSRFSHNFAFLRVCVCDCVCVSSFQTQTYHVLDSIPSIRFFFSFSVSYLSTLFTVALEHLSDLLFTRTRATHTNFRIGLRHIGNVHWIHIRRTKWCGRHDGKHFTGKWYVGVVHFCVWPKVLFSELCVVWNRFDSTQLMTVNYRLIEFSILLYRSLSVFSSSSALFDATGGVNLFALIGGIGCIVLAVLIVIIILSVRRHSAKYYTNEDKRNGKFIDAVHLFRFRSGRIRWREYHFLVHFILQMDCTRRMWTHCQLPEMKSVSNFLWTMSSVQLTIWFCRHQRQNHHHRT